MASTTAVDLTGEYTHGLVLFLKNVRALLTFEDDSFGQAVGRLSAPRKLSQYVSLDKS